MDRSITLNWEKLESIIKENMTNKHCEKQQ